jgi:hypothetical protein
VFALGVALSAGFIGGAASLTSSLNDAAKRTAVAVSAGGGIAVLFIAFGLFEHFKPKTCNLSIQSLVEANEQITALNKKISTFKVQPVTIVIPPSGRRSLPAERIAIQYTDKYGETRDAKRTSSKYEVSLDDLLVSGEIFVGFRADAIPAERQGQSQRIAIDQFSYTSDPLELRLWLVEPKELLGAHTQ